MRRTWLLASLLCLATPLTGVAEGAPFDPAATALPAGFKGDDIVAVFRSLLIAPKGEFETSEQFEARKAAAPPSAVHAFLVRKPEFEYDADAALFTVEVDTEEACDRTACGSLLTVLDDFKFVRNYEASNAFGATVKVGESREDLWGILLPKRNRPKLELELPMAPERAQQLAARLALLAVLRTGPESVIVPYDVKNEATGSGYTKATIDSPREVTTYEHALRGTVLGLWAFDRDTGEVFGKFDVDGRQVNPDGSLVPLRLKPAKDTADVMRRVLLDMTTAEVAEVTKPLTPQVAVTGKNREEWTFLDHITVEFKKGRVAGMRSKYSGRLPLTRRPEPAP